MAIVLQIGDVVLTRGDGWLGRAIRYFQRGKGEEFSKVNHVGIVVESPDVIVEALWTVKRHSIQRYTKPGNQVAIYRSRMVASNHVLQAKLKNCAEEYGGRKYGVLKILLHAGDRALANVTGRQDVYGFRRLASIDRYPICSYVVAKAYDRIGIRFMGTQPRACQPDDIFDHVSRSLGWECVLPLQRLEPGMIASSLTTESAKEIA